MKRRLIGVCVVLAAAGLSASTLLSGVCAEPARGPQTTPMGSASAPLSITVFSTVSGSPGGYLYEYSVYCGTSNESVVDMFGLRQVGPHYAVEMPQGWRVIEGHPDAPKSLSWVAVGYDESPDANLDFLVNPPENAIQPGQSVSGFRIWSTNPQVAVGIVAQYYSVDLYDSEDDFPTGPFMPHPSIWSGGNAYVTVAPSLNPATAGADSGLASEGPLGRPMPNPTRDAVQMNINLTRRGFVRVTIVDAAGRRVATPVSRWLEPGRVSAAWSGLNERGIRVAGGVYFVQMTLNGVKVGEHRVVLVR